MGNDKVTRLFFFSPFTSFCAEYKERLSITNIEKIIGLWDVALHFIWQSKL